jgi:hypothetical protein
VKEYETIGKRRALLATATNMLHEEGNGAVQVGRLGTWKVGGGNIHTRLDPSALDKI